MTNAGASGPAARREQGAERDHGADGDEEGGAVADGADSGSEEREALLLDHVGEFKARGNGLREARNFLSRRA